MKYIVWLTALLWTGMFLTTCIEAVWIHALPEVTPFIGFMYLLTAWILSLSVLASYKEKP